MFKWDAFGTSRFLEAVAKRREPMWRIDYGPPQCQAPGCKNEARYHVPTNCACPEHGWAPVWCGIHDIEHNGGRGRLRRELDEDVKRG